MPSRKEAVALLLPAVLLRRAPFGPAPVIGRVGALRSVGPRCGACGAPRLLVLAVDLSGLKNGGAEALTLAVCRACVLDGDDGTRSTLWTGPARALPEVTGGAAIVGVDCVSAPDGEGLHALVTLPTDFDAYQEAIEAWQDTIGETRGQDLTGMRVGGHPEWLQGEATPRCPEHGRMRLRVQLFGADMEQVDVGDGGALYAFACPHDGCARTRLVTQSH